MILPMTIARKTGVGRGAPRCVNQATGSRSGPVRTFCRLRHDAAEAGSEVIGRRNPGRSASPAIRWMARQPPARVNSRPM